MTSLFGFPLLIFTHVDLLIIRQFKTRIVLFLVTHQDPSIGRVSSLNQIKIPLSIPNEEIIL